VPQSTLSDFEVIKTLKHASQWQYTTDHAEADVMSENYFQNFAADRFEVGDEIKVVLLDGKKVIDKFWVDVTKCDGGETVVERRGDALAATPRSRTTRRAA
jgi:hypothetical protein